LSQQRNESLPKRIDQYPSLRDYYDDLDRFKVTDAEREEYQKFLSGLTDAEKAILNGGFYFYVVDLKNVGGSGDAADFQSRIRGRHERRNSDSGGDLALQQL
jgi:hypothetical protein